MGFYFCGFMVVGNFFFLQLFVAVLFFEFEKANKDDTKEFLQMTDSQARWIQIQRVVLDTRAEYTFYKVPTNKIQKFLYTIAFHRYFEYTILVCILLNIVVMGFTFEGSSDAFDNNLSVVNTVFTSIFIGECLLKILALTFPIYIYSPWNKFDFFVVLTSILDLILGAIGASFISFLRTGPQLLRILRVLRVTRLLRLVKSLKTLETMIRALIYSIPAMLNALALILLVFFIMSVLAVFLFKPVTTGYVIDSYNNFANFGWAMITLYRTTTGENWPYFMYDTWHTAECVHGQTCGTSFSSLFWISQQIICSLIMIQLFVLVTNNSLAEYHDESNPLHSMGDYLEDFKQKWCDFTSSTDGKLIRDKQILPFFLTLNKPLGFEPGTSKLEAAKRIQTLNIVLDHGCLTFNETLFYAMKNAFGRQTNQQSKFLKAFLVLEELKTRKALLEISRKVIVRVQTLVFNMTIDTSTHKERIV
jgi:hypothetical protein